jgi:mannose-6-phosphate isomerase-like protein (cupin superfamily)
MVLSFSRRRMTTLTCDVCGKKATIGSKKRGAAFCTNACFDEYEGRPGCVSHYNMNTLVLENNDFRKIIYTNSALQFIVMTVPVGGKIGDETDPNKPELHQGNTQFMRIEEGRARVTIYVDEKPFPFTLESGGEDTAIIPPCNYHLIENIGPIALRLYLIYSPPAH